MKGQTSASPNAFSSPTPRTKPSCQLRLLRKGGFTLAAFHALLSAESLTKFNFVPEQEGIGSSLLKTGFYFCMSPV